jgi:uncharacterized protein YbjQ (UPF0145 family)
MLPNSLYLRLMTNILITTTPTVENRPVLAYLGIVSGEAFIDSFISSEHLSMMLHEARDWAIQQMAKEAASLGTNAVIGVKIEYKTISEPDKNVRVMILVATGTAVRL